MPKISVIIPCYRVEKYLDRCMDSILNQTLQDIEIILVDDGSPDRVPEMCDEYAAKDSRIKVIHKKNGGLGYARNSGLEIATGQYVAFVDSDDYVDLTMYETLYHTAVKTGCDAVFCGFNEEGSSGKWTRSDEVKEVTEMRGNGVTDFMLDMVANHHSEPNERKYYMSVWHAIYRMDIIRDNKISFLSERDVASEDIPFQIDFLSRSNSIAYIPDNFYYYCLNGASLTAVYKADRYDRFRRLYFILKNKLQGVPDGENRAHRFFIGYTRTQFHQLMQSDSNHKIGEIKRIVNDPIWDALKFEYPERNYIRKDIKLMYHMILNKQSWLLYLNSKLINAARKIIGRR